MKILKGSDLEKWGKDGRRQLYPDGVRITVGLATCGKAKGAGEVFAALRKELRKSGVRASLEESGCGGLCSREPIVTVQQPGMPMLTFCDMKPADAAGLAQGIKRGALPLDKALCRMEAQENVLTGEILNFNGSRPAGQYSAVPEQRSLPFFKYQKRIALRNCGFIAPANLAQYIARGGFSAARAAITAMKPEAVIGELRRSGLRGRGGAGFPTGDKWASVAAAEGTRKYFICNADEGDPGAYMDRSLIEGDPYSVLEGMIIGARATGASRGIIYVREEYPLAVERVTEAVAELKKAGLLGRRIFGSDFSFTVTVQRGAGAFVCGEETALIASLEGRAGEPVGKPPYPAQRGLYGMPTCINNVETLAAVPVIVSRGGRWYSRIGAGKSRGTKVFSLVGAVDRVGLIEVPMGTPLEKIIYNIGGGFSGGRTLKAVQTGGPSGGCIPARLAGLTADYESLTAAGSIMGSGGMIAMDNTACMVDVAKYFMGFLRGESCGKCLPCRQGTQEMYRILEAVTAGRGKKQDLARLREIAEAMSGAALCGLGKTAANPVLSSLKYFQKEFEAHLRGSCPAGVCRDLIQFSINAKKCTGCGLCRKACPTGAVKGERKKAHAISKKNCIKCRACFEACPAGAVEIR